MRRELMLAVMIGAAALGGCTRKQAPGNASDLAGGGAADDPDAGNGEDPALARLQADLAANAGDRVFFTFDAYALSPDARATLTRQAQWLRQHPRVGFLVEGHADERGTREYNIALGARRAQSVRSFLASRGIDPNRMRTISYGKERPVAVCNDISCWSQNRRAVTVLNASS